eukprot:jgi/Mesvir1/5349/Mv15438-RA.1
MSVDEILGDGPDPMFDQMQQWRLEQKGKRVNVASKFQVDDAEPQPGAGMYGKDYANIDPKILAKAAAVAAEREQRAAAAAVGAPPLDRGPPPVIDYKDTVNLPVTSFDMRANSAVREPEIQKVWEETELYRRLWKNAKGPVFTLHDGPPYANGSLHMGHALNKILKDFINRYMVLQGHRVRFVPGWDCHGLPIELKVLQSMKSKAGLTPLKIREEAEKFALATVQEQMAAFKRYGVLGEWERPYLTLRPKYEAAQMGVFAKMVLNGHIYRGLKPVHWSPSSRTALAEAELEYPDGHTSRSIYAGFKLESVPKAFPKELSGYLGKLGVAVWTTTPWTIPANLAVAFNAKLKYVVTEVKTPKQAPAPAATPAAEASASDATATDKKKKGGKKGAAASDKPAPAPPASVPSGEWTCQYVIVAQDLVDTLASTLGVTLEVKGEVPASALEGCTYRHPLYDRVSPVVPGGDYITTESGTGLVHIAPGHGQEDYIVGQKFGLPLLSPVDDAGKFTEEAGDKFQGLNVLAEGNTAIVEALAASKALMLEKPYEHKYPYDWRTKKPTIFRATRQWFASVDGFRQQALDAIKSVEWIPAVGEKRITAMVNSRSDWCISRQRSWGVPIPVFYHKATGEPLISQESMAHITSLVSQHGSSCWWTMSNEELLPESHRSKANEYERGTDTMDVWFDSGSSWASVCQQRQDMNVPADLYLEGSDQHRGWFQSSLLTSVATEGRAPYKQVLTHGFVLDERGFKMSKSVGNVMDPNVIISGGNNQKTEPAYGADVLRLWVASCDYTSDVLIGPKIIEQVAESYRKLRFTMRYLLGNLDGFEPRYESVPYAKLPSVDRYMLHKLSALMTDVKEAYDKYQFYQIYQAIQRFVVVELSNFYFDVSKDRLYTGSLSSQEHQACRTVLTAVLSCLLRTLAPLTPHMAEDIWSKLPFPASQLDGDEDSEAGASVFEGGWAVVRPEWGSMPAEEVELWDNFKKVGVFSACVACVIG